MIGLVLAAAVFAAQPKPVLIIDPKHTLVEGVATDGTTIWVSSVLDRKVLACRDRCRELATLPKGLHPLGIAWDRKRQRLWVVADCPKLPGVPACEQGALVALDRSGRVRTRIAPTTGSFHPGDVTADPAGVFVSDSQDGAVYRLNPKGQALVALVKPGTGKSAQGLALNAEGKNLIAADYSQGISDIDLSSRGRFLLPRQDGKPLRGIDGLARCGDTYFGVYNGSAPGRIVSIKILAGRLTYELVEGLTLPDPTQIAFDDKRLLVVAHAGWELAAKRGSGRSEGAPIIAIPLSEDCKPL